MNRKELIEKKIRDLIWYEQYDLKELQSIRLKLEVYQELLEQEIKNEQDGFVRIEE